MEIISSIVGMLAIFLVILTILAPFYIWAIQSDVRKIYNEIHSYIQQQKEREDEQKTN
jgi:hypothetical protein